MTLDPLVLRTDTETDSVPYSVSSTRSADSLNHRSEIRYPPLKTPITLLLYPALNGLALWSTTLASYRIDIADELGHQGYGCIWVPFYLVFSPVRCGPGLALKSFKLALLVRGKWERRRTTERRP